MAGSKKSEAADKAELVPLEGPALDATVAAFAHYLFRGGDADEDTVRDAARKGIAAGRLFGDELANAKGAT